MGGGTYSSSIRDVRATASDLYSKSSQEIFSKSVNNAMDPFNLVVRESRDSVEHPNSAPIIIALDLTGSMGSIPLYLVKQGLPKMMDLIIKKGIPDPQVLFTGVGDHECDKSPLQVGQFESSDELLDKWLTDIFLEGGGGGNEGESYLLAWYLAARHTSTDSFEKRGKKGILFTIGDEPTLKTLPARTLKNIMGEGEFKDYTAQELLDLASKTYEVFHIHFTSTRNGSMVSTQSGWAQLLGPRCLFANNPDEVATIIADKVVEHFSTSKISKQTSTSIDKEEFML
jgi:hypothetical protein